MTIVSTTQHGVHIHVPLLRRLWTRTCPASRSMKLEDLERLVDGVMVRHQLDRLTERAAELRDLPDFTAVSIRAEKDLFRCGGQTRDGTREETLFVRVLVRDLDLDLGMNVLNSLGLTRTLR